MVLSNGREGSSGRANEPVSPDCNTGMQR